MKPFKQLLEGVIQPNGTDKIEEDGLKDTCWKGYEAIGTKKKNGKEVPNCVPVKEEALDEGKMAQLHADIEDHLAKHVANYKKVGGAEHLGNKTVEVAKKIAKLHNISHEAAQKHVNDYVDHNLKEETDAEKAAKELKLKLTKWKNQQRAAKALGEEKKEEPPFTPDPPKKNPIAKAGKYGLGHSIAKHLAKQGMKKLTKEDLDEAYRLPSDSEIDKVKAHVKANHPNKSLAQVAVHKASKKIEYVVKDKDGKMSGHTLGEEVEQIDEISKQTLGSYVHKSFAAGNELHKQIDKETDPVKKAELKAKLSQRNTGVIKAAKKLREEESMLSFDDFMKEQKACSKEELHPNQKKLDKNKNGKIDSHDFVKLRSGKKEVDEKYVNDAQRKAVWASKNEKGVKEEAELDEATSPMQKLRDAHERHMQKALAANKAGDDVATKVHQQYMQKITAKMNKLKQNEEIDLAEMEELCEISKATLGSYVKKAGDDYTKREVRIDRALSKDITTDTKAAEKKQANRKTGISKAVDKLTKEEVEELDEISKDTLKSYVKGAAQDLPRLGNTLGRLQTHGKLKGVEDKITKSIHNRYHGINKATEKLTKEEVEHLAEADVAAIRAEYKKNESDNKHTENAALLAKHFGSKSDQNKVAKAKAYRDQKGGYGSDALSRHHSNMAYEVHKKLYHHIKEEVEQIDELDKKTLGSYVNKSHDQLMKHTASVNMKYGRGDKDATAYALDKDALRKTANRTQGMKTAVKKLTKEGTESMLTFKELMENISEGKIDDLKDKIAARKATQSAYDKDYKPAAKSNVTKVKGHSYGAGENESGEEDDDNNKTLSKPAKPEVKRGRGRPSGSKSGARN